MKKRRPATAIEKIGALLIGVLLLAIVWFFPWNNDLHANKARAQTAGLALLLILGTVWTLWRKRPRKKSQG